MTDVRQDPAPQDLPPVRVLISYRLDDAEGSARRLYDSLSERFGREQVRIDIPAFEPGVAFSEIIAREVGACDVLLAVIGPSWLSITDAEGRRRVDDPADRTRLEIQSALEHNLRVIPCLVQNARTPALDDLPQPIQRLALRNALELSDEGWEYDLGRLNVAIESVARSKALQAKAEPRAPAPDEAPAEPGEAPVVAIPDEPAVEVPEPEPEPPPESQPEPEPEPPPESTVEAPEPTVEAPESEPEPEPEPPPEPEPERPPETAPPTVIAPPVPVEPVSAAAMATAPILPAPLTEPVTAPAPAPPPPPSEPTEPRRSRLGVLIGIVLGVLVVAGGVTAFLLTRVESPLRTILPVVAASPSIVISTPTTTAPADPHAELIARVPADFRATCADDDANYLPDRALGGIRCTAPGIEVWYYLFPAGANVDDWYSRRLADSGIEQGMGGDCARDDRGEDQLQVGGADVQGRLFCLDNDRGRWIEWKRTDFRIYAYALRADGNRAALYEFWTGAGPNAL